MSFWRLLLLSSFVLSCQPAFAASEPAGTSFESLYDSAEKAFGQNNYGLAERSYLAALKVAETSKLGASDPRWPKVYKGLAGLYELRSQFPKSELYMEKELRAREKSLGSENPQVLACVAKLCRFYLAHGNQVKADRLSNLLLSYAGRLQKEEEQLDGHFAALQKFYSAHSEYAETGKNLKTLRESADRVRADDHLELAANLDGIAALYKEKNKLPFAEQLYKRSLELREKTLAPGHQALAFAYENLGNLYLAQGKTQQAQPFFEQSLQITKKSLDFKRPEVYSRLDNLARSYVSMGQISEAESLYKQALTLIQENSGTGAKDYGSASFALANLYMRQGRYGQAEPLLKTALKISEGIYGPQSASLLPTLDAYAESLEKNGKGSEASKYRQKANHIKGNTSACKETIDF